MKTTSYKVPNTSRRLNAEQLFMAGMFVVNAGNFFYNLLLGRILGPTGFADAAILITFLLVLSFLGMTFQLVTSKYTILMEGDALGVFINKITKYGITLGLLIGALIAFFHVELQMLFHTQTSTMFVVFGCGIPLYFLISINRGFYQGKKNLQNMAITYQTEMMSRIVITVLLLLLLPNIPGSVSVASGILISFVFGLFPIQKQLFRNTLGSSDESFPTKGILMFFALTAFYECTQIIINNSDILLVKHYFKSQEAGLYSSLALIGRIVYFVSWMFIMLLLPKVIQLKKDKQKTEPTLMKYVGYIVLLSTVIIAGCYLFPETVVLVMFGDKYLSIAPLLWKYALATSVFAIANIFAYYFLSIGKYKPVIIAAILGLAQIGLIVAFHESLDQVVDIQVIAMVVLLFFQLIYFFYQNKKDFRLS